MKKLIFLLWVTGMATPGFAEPQIGMRVIPPSQRGYTTDAIRESGERGGLLLPVGDRFTGAYNQEMGEAMELWNAHRWAEAVAAFRRIWQQHPDSPWAAEAELHEACYLKYNALYDEAEERFLGVLAKHPQSAEIRIKVLRYLPHLYAQTARYQTALDLLHELGRLPIGWQERQYIENDQRIFGRLLAKEATDRLCGTKALALALAAQNDKGERLRNVSLQTVFKRYWWAGRAAADERGFSVQDLAALANAQPVELDLPTLRAALRPGRPVLVYLRCPPEPKCFRLLAKPARAADPPRSGHFVVVESIADGHVDLLDPDSGRVRWSLAHFRYRWSGVALWLPVQGDLPGRVLPAERAANLRGGCCGNPPPDPSDECEAGDGGEAGGGSSGDNGLIGGLVGAAYIPRCQGPGCGGSGGGAGGSSSSPCCQEEEGQESSPGDADGPHILPHFSAGFGAPTYRFGLASANLSLKDIPLWATDAKGPRLNLQLIYNRVATQRMARHTGANYHPFGAKWHCNLFSYYTLAPNDELEFALPGGRVQRFQKTCDGDVCRSRPTDIWNQNRLTNQGPYHVLEFKNSGNKWYFTTDTNTARFFIPGEGEGTASALQRLEKIQDKYGNALTFFYEDVTGRLTNVTDAIGRWLRFHYNAQGYVTNVTDSFGRCARFDYQDGDLVAITDMGGETTLIQYDTNHWPTNIVYPSGHAWRLAYQQEELLPPWTSGPFAISVTDPLDQTHEYLYTGAGWYGAMPITLRDKAGNNWLYAAKQVGGNSDVGGTLRTYYTAVNAVTQHVGGGEYCVNADQWSRSDFDVSTGQRLSTALANTNFQTSIGWMCGEGTWIADLYITNCYDANRNLLSYGLLTNCTFDYSGQLTDGTPVGIWTNHYDSRDNLIWTKNPLGQETRYGYSPKDKLTAVTNALGHFTLMSYDHNGNLTNLVDALLRTNRWTYDANGRNVQTIYADGLTISRGYDAIGRVSAVTNHGSGLHLSYFYDNLDRLRDVVFPDGTSNHFQYSCCGLDWTRDRLNRTTFYGRDALGRTTAVTNPQNHVVEFRYNGANQITNLITWVGGQPRVKRFDYTATNGFSRLTQVTTPMGKTIRYDYTFRGHLFWRQDGNGRVTKFEYDPLGRLVRVADTNHVTLCATDWAGNVSTTNLVFVRDYTADTTPPAVALLWPLHGQSLVGDTFTVRGTVDDATATVWAHIVNAAGVTNRAAGLIERHGRFWVEDLPLSAGTNWLTLTAMDAAGNSAVTNLAVVKSDLALTMNPVDGGALLKRRVRVSGTVSDPAYAVWVNGVPATVAADGRWEAVDVEVEEGGVASFYLNAYPPGQHPPPPASPSPSRNPPLGAAPGRAVDQE